jgi:hypothetical protein
VKDQSLTGPDINVSTLGTVPSATSANSLAGSTPFAVYTGPGLTTLVSVGPFTIKGSCVINNAGRDEAELQLYTSVDNAVMDDNNGDEITPFNVASGHAELLFTEVEPTGESELESGQREGLVAVAPDGTTIASDTRAVGMNLPGHANQCFFAGTINKLH